MLLSRHTRRREFIAGLGSAAWPLAARAQQPSIPAIGWLDPRSPSASAEIFDAFRYGLVEIGFAEGRNFSIIPRYAEGNAERQPALAADLVSHRVAVIVVPASTASVLAAKAMTQTIPIVFVMGGDPVELGVVASLNRPSGNVTGINVQSTNTAGKRIELLHKLVPTAKSIALLTGRNPAPFNQAETRAIESAASTLGLRLMVLTAGAESMSADLVAAFVTIVEQQAGALLISANTNLDAARDQIISLAARYAIPTMFFYGPSVVAGGLMSYGPDITDAFRQAGIYAGRILKGEKPADLPVARSDKFGLVFNLKTASALGLVIPPMLLALADRVIE
jgi:putative ABC transport system substrate-binding protein